MELSRSGQSGHQDLEGKWGNLAQCSMGVGQEGSGVAVQRGKPGKTFLRRWRWGPDIQEAPHAVSLAGGLGPLRVSDEVP